METERCSSSPIQPAANGSDTPMMSRPTVTFAGKPTAKTFICGTTRETMPNAASVMTIARTTGAASSSADRNTSANASCTPPTIAGSDGMSSSGTRS